MSTNGYGISSARGLPQENSATLTARAARIGALAVMRMHANSPQAQWSSAGAALLGFDTGVDVTSLRGAR